MLQTNAFSEHTMQQNATVARALLRTPLKFGAVQRFPRSSRWFEGGRSMALRGGDREGGEAQERRGRRDDVDSDAKLLPNRLNRKPIGSGGGGEP